MKRFGMLFCLLATLTAEAVEGVKPRLNLVTRPEGAVVTVDGQKRGVTPMMIFDLTPARHLVQLRLPGYQPCDRFADTREDPVSLVDEDLEPERGLLLVQSDPTGADIRIGGLSVGSTPRLLTDLTTKDEHEIRLVKPGYQDRTVSVRFNGRTPQVRCEKLVRDSGILNVTSEPSGAEVTVNGIVRGKTPLVVRDVPKGRAIVKFSLAGFNDAQRELAVRAGDEQTLPVALVACPGTLHLTSVPPGARFYVNDEPRGAGPLTIPDLKPGTYVVRAECEGYGTLSKELVLENGGSVREEFTLSNVMGRLEIKTSPVGATLMLDGRILGQTKSPESDAAFSDKFPVENVVAGEHTLVVRLDGYAERVLHPKVTQSHTESLTVRLRRLFIADIEIVTDRGTYQGVLVSKDASGVLIETKPGVSRFFSNAEIRKVTFLKKAP